MQLHNDGLYAPKCANEAKSTNENIQALKVIDESAILNSA